MALTPSMLMCHIVRSEKNDRIHFLLRDYFEEAFGIPLLRNVVFQDDYSPSLRHAHFNRDVVPEMIRRIGEWNTASLEGSWLQGLSVHSLSEHVERLKDARPDELPRIWDDLNDKEKISLLRKSATINQQWEAMKVLASMVERLQEQVVQLEARLTSEQSSRTCSKEAIAPHIGDS